MTTPVLIASRAHEDVENAGPESEGPLLPGRVAVSDIAQAARFTGRLTFTSVFPFYQSVLFCCFVDLHARMLITCVYF